MKKVFYALVVMFMFCVSQKAFVQISETEYFHTNGIAIRGYDPVAYFTEGRPLRGSSLWEVTWRGVIWRFSSEENKDLFEENPEMYSPQYGGYCAYAVSRDYTATTDPDAWSIVEGRLFLNYSPHVRRIWNRATEDNIERGDRNWPNLRLGFLE